MTEAKPLTASSTIGEWLTNPAGGPLVRGLLAQTGASEEMLAPITHRIAVVSALSASAARTRHPGHQLGGNWPGRWSDRSCIVNEAQLEERTTR